MTDTTATATKPVLACVDGSENGDRALRYGLQEAARRGTSVRLLHVPPDLIPYAPLSPMYELPNPHEIGAGIVKEALDRATELADDVAVEGAVATGPRVQAIVEESEKASCIVVGTREWSALRVFGGSTSAGVATRAPVPLIAVPPSWQGQDRDGGVLVGVDEEVGPEEPLEAAFAEARLRGVDLTVLHAWSAPPAYLPAVDAWDPRAWEEAAVQRMRERTAGLRERYADLPVHLVARYDAPEAALTEFAENASLLVLGRHRRMFDFLHRLGSLAHRALQSGVCPLQIVPVAKK